MKHAFALDVSTEVVSGDTAAGENQPGWMFNRDTSTDTPFEFNENKHSVGVGSLYVKPIGVNPSDKFIGENFLLTPIADINSIKYDFLIAGNGDSTDANQFYMNIYANFDESPETKFYDCRYSVIPLTGSASGFSTVTFDPEQNYSFTQSPTSPHVCPASPADMNFEASNGAIIRMFSLNVGDTSGNDSGLAGYLDKVITDVSGEILTYDFEPSDTDPPVVTYISPLEGQIVGKTDLSFEISDETTIVQYSFNINGPGTNDWDTRKWTPNAAFVSDSINLCAEDRLHACDESDLPGGTYIVKTIAYDGLGHDSRSQQPLTFILDKTAPTVSLTDPADDSIVNTVLVDGEISDPKLYFFNIQLKNETDPNWNFTTQRQYADSQTIYTLNDFDLLAAAWYGLCDGEPCSSWDHSTPLPSGSYGLRVNAYDEFGNRTIYSHNFTLDTQPPTAEITSPTETKLIAGNTLSISGTAKDEANFGYYKYHLEDSSGTQIGAPEQGDSEVEGGELGVLDLTDLPNGEYFVNLTVFDKALNSTNDKVKFEIDNEPPVVTINQLPESLDTTPTITGHVQDDSSVVVTAVLHGISKPIIPSPGGNWSVNYTVLPGIHPVSVTAEDEVHNPTQDPVTMTFRVNNGVIQPTLSNRVGAVANQNNLPQTGTDDEDEDEEEVLGEQTANPIAQPAALGDSVIDPAAACVSFFGMCWYWFAPITLGLAAVIYYVYRSFKKESAV